MKESFHGANINQEAFKYSLKPEEILDFSSNINIFMPDINWEKITKEIKNNINRYPDNNYTDLKYSISKIYGIKKENIFPGNGATELIFLLTQMRDIKNIGIFMPTFSEYERAGRINLKNIINLSFEKTYTKSDFENIDMIFICNPNNPTGQIRDLKNLLKFTKETSTLMVVDETFIDFMRNENYSLKEKIYDYENLIVLSAMTKYLPFTASRLGYIFTKNESVLKNLEFIRHPWSINVLAKVIAREMENINSNFHLKTKDYYERESQRLYRKLSEIKNITPYETRANFMLCKLENKEPDIVKENLLKNHHLSIRTTYDYVNLDSSHIRIAIKSEEQNNILISALKDVLE